MTSPSPTAPGEPTPRLPRIFDGPVLIRTIATALIRLADIRTVTAFTLPYPDEAQRALDRVVLACLLRQAEPPRSVPDLIAWCRYRSVPDWPLDLPDGLFGPKDVLLDPEAGLPTQLCHEWALNTRDSAADEYDQLVIRSAFQLCRQYGDAESYTEFRRLLVNQPVLTTNEMFTLHKDLRLIPVMDLIEQIYDPVPDGYRRHGTYTACGRCLTLLTPLTDGGWWCERDRCRSLGSPPLGEVHDAEKVGTPLQLARPLRQFVTGPGRAEVELAERLMGRRLKLRVEMWPEFDAYDLRVVFPDDHVWAVEVKDWASPALLGQKITEVRATQPYDEVFLVVPDYRFRARPDYRDVYLRHRSPGLAAMPLLTDRELVATAAKRLTSLPRTRASRQHAEETHDA